MRKATIDIRTGTLAFFLGLTLVAALVFSCKKREVPYVSDNDQITSYIGSSDDARSLFRTDSIIGTTPYQLPNSTASFRDSVLSVNRHVVVQIGNAQDYGYLGVIKEALATVVDNYTVRTFRTTDSGTTSTDVAHAVTRYGFFLKLGNDAQPYLGWVLYGFNGFLGGLSQNPAVSIDLAIPGDTTAVGDRRLYTDTLLDVTLAAPKYVKLRDMLPVAKGKAVVTNIDASLSSVAVYPQLSAVEASGVHYQIMNDRSAGLWVDTTTTAAVSSKRFDILVIQFINKGTGAPALTPVTIPFRVI